MKNLSKIVPLLVGLLSGVFVFIHNYVFLSHGHTTTVFVPGFIFGVATLILFRGYLAKKEKRHYAWIFVCTLSFICAYFLAIFLAGTADRGEDYMLVVAFISASLVGSTILYLGFRYIFHSSVLKSPIYFFVVPAICALYYTILDMHSPVSSLFLFTSWQTATTLILTNSILNKN